MNFELYEILTEAEKEAANLFIIRGSTLLVNISDKEEKKTAGGIIIAEDSRQRVNSVGEHEALVAKVIKCGEGYYDPETNEKSPCDLKPGAILHLPKYSTSYLSTFPGLPGLTGLKLAYVKEGEVIGYWANPESHKAYSEAVNRAYLRIKENKHA